MTVWVDWQSWTYFIGQDVVFGEQVLELDFPNRRITYRRETGNNYAENRHPFGTKACEDFVYETIEAAYEHVWVDPGKRLSLGQEELDSLGERRKPQSFVELVDVDPRDYFQGEAQTISMSAPGVLFAATSRDERSAASDSEIAAPMSSEQALAEFRQLQRHIGEGWLTLLEAAPRAILLLGVIEPIEVAWPELDPWVAIKVREILRQALLNHRAGRLVEVSSSTVAAVLRVAVWADHAGILSKDPAYQFMNQTAADMLDYVRSHLGRELPDPGMSWYGVANKAFCNARESPEAKTWLTISIEIWDWLASQSPDADHSSPMREAMYARVHRFRLPDVSRIDRDRDCQEILDWFLRDETMAPEQAAICPRDACEQSAAARKQQRRIRKKLGVMQMLHESGASLPPRIGEWLALVPHL